MKIKILSILWSVLLILFISSCDEMNDLHQPYLDDGEKIYASMVDSVAAHGGEYRVKLEMFLRSQRVEKVRVYWNQDQDSLDVAINGQRGIFNQIIPELPEGELIFNLVSFDNFGNNSLKYEVTAESYGEVYVSKLVNRRISDMEYVEDTLVINWGTIGSHVGTNFSYTNFESDISHIYVADTVNVTKITNFVSEGEYSYKTMYVPNETAIDTFETVEPVTGTFPVFIEKEGDD